MEHQSNEHQTDQHHSTLHDEPVVMPPYPEDHHDTGGTHHGEEGGHGEGHGHPELPNFVELLHKSPLGDTPPVQFMNSWNAPLFSMIVVVVMGFVFMKATSKKLMVPNRLQNFAEMLVDGLAGFFGGILGDKYGKKFSFYCFCLFVFIWCNNMMGMIPLMKAPTSMFQTTIALAACTFFYVQYIALRENGPWGYLHHLMGSPKDTVGWCLVPLMMPLHLIEEIAKPMSLALRLFGNILGEDILLAVMAGLGIALVALMPVPEWTPGIPFQLPFMFLSLLLGTIQALVFSLLSCIYIVLILPHEDHH